MSCQYEISIFSVLNLLEISLTLSAAVHSWLTKQKSHEIFRFHGIFWRRNAIQIRAISLGCSFCRFSKGDGLCTLYKHLIIVEIDGIDEGVHQCLPLVFQAHIQLAEAKLSKPDELLFHL